MDGLAKSYAGRPVVFVQYELDSPVSLLRHQRFMTAWNLDKSPAERAPDTPHTMVDSGQTVSYGERDFLADFRTMINGELPRPAGAIISASRQRPDSLRLVVKAQVTNVTTTTLQTGLNSATLHAVAYEGNRSLHYGTTVHLSHVIPLDEALEPGQTRLYEFTLNLPRGVNSSLVDVVVMLDYLPQGGEGRWDMLQAAIAQTRELPPSPTPWATPVPPPTRTPLPTATPSPTATPTLAPTEESLELPPVYLLYMPRAVKRW